MTRVATADLKAMRKHAGAAVAMLRALLSQSALSQHLAKLRDEGLVETRREAQSIFYRIADAKAARLLGVLHELYCKR